MAFKQQLPFKLPFSTLPNVELSKRPNRIVYGNDVLIDLTNDTVTESDVLKGVIFHKADGTLSTGTFEPIDLTSDTVTADVLLSGYTAHDKNGNLITGIYEYVEKIQFFIKNFISCNIYSNSISTRTFSVTEGYYLLVAGVGGASASNYGEITVSGGTSLYSIKNNNVSSTYGSYCEYQGLAVYLAKVTGSGSISCSFKSPNHCKSSNAILYKLKADIEEITPTQHTSTTYTSEGTRTYTLSKGIYLVATTVCGGNNSESTYGVIDVSVSDDTTAIMNFQNAKSYGSGDYTTYLGTCCCEVRVVDDSTTLSIKTLRNGDKSVAVGTIIIKLN